MVGLAVVGMGNGNVTLPKDGKSPRPRSTVQYPIRFDNAPPARIQQPRPTVSYPIRFPSPEGDR